MTVTCSKYIHMLYMMLVFSSGVAVCVYILMYVCTNVRMYVCMHVCTYINFPRVSTYLRTYNSTAYVVRTYVHTYVVYLLLLPFHR